MALGQVIRKYRKMKSMTQEEMAARLGVSAPAVNKWENGNSFPDIMLLAPIARLLEISLDTLLAFREDLTAEEVQGIIDELDEKLKQGSYDEAFRWAKKKLEQYPNCGQLMVSAAVMLEVQAIVQKLPQGTEYEEYCCSLYHRALESSDEAVRVRAADALVGFYRRKKEYARAETYLDYFSLQNPLRKMQQALIYEETNRVQEAYRIYEELLFADYQRINAQLQGMYQLALREKDKEKAEMLVKKQVEMAKCFEMGRYYEVLPRLAMALQEEDKEAVAAIGKEILSLADHMDDFRNSPLFEHMKFKAMRKEFLAEVKENLQKSFAMWERNEGKKVGEEDETWQEERNS